MSDRIRFTFDKTVQEHLSTEDLVRLTESLYSFVEHGLIECDTEQEFYIDSEYLQNLIGCINTLYKASKKYGKDENGLVKYPFKDLTDGN
jgi:hypothetical protein